MLVLLPPSEGKTPPPADGAPLDLTRLVAPGLRPTRERVLDALVEASARPDARELLGVGATVADEVARNVTLRSAPTREARHVYSGVLYAAAGADRLEGAALERAERHVRTVSALWGLVAPTDPIPAYRLSMQARCRDSARSRGRGALRSHASSTGARSSSSTAVPPRTSRHGAHPPTWRGSRSGSYAKGRSCRTPRSTLAGCSWATCAGAKGHRPRAPVRCSRSPASSSGLRSSTPAASPARARSTVSSSRSRPSPAALSGSRRAAP